MKKITSLVLISISVLIFSCETKTGIGYNILPEEDKLDYNIIDTSSIEVYTLLMDTLASDKTSTLMLGVYTDPIFGTSKSSFVCQFGLSEHPLFTDEHIIDSAVLSIPLDTLNLKHYGNSENIQHLTVYMIGNDLVKDTTYYGNYDSPYVISSSDTIIGQKDIVSKNIPDSIISIKLTQEFANKIASLKSDVISADNYKKFLKGIYVKAESIGNDGAIIKLKVNSDFNIKVYAHNGANEYIYKTSANMSSNIRFNIFEHDYSSQSFYSQIGNESSPQDSVAYIQSMGGLRTKIKMPFITDLKELGDIVIYRAELVVKTAPDYLSFENTYPAIDAMTLIGYSPENEYYSLREFISGGRYLGVGYNKDNGTYKFDIAGYIRDIIDGNIENNGLYLFTQFGNNKNSRAIITTGNHSNRMKLYISYAKL